MEDRIRELEIANARFATSIEHLTDTVRQLHETVQELRDTLNKGRGALWLAMSAAGAIGAMLATIAKRMLGIA